MDPDNQMQIKPMTTQFNEEDVCHGASREGVLPEKVYPMEKENEETPPKKSSSAVDLSNKIQLVFNLDGFKEAGGEYIILPCVT